MIAGPRSNRVARPRAAGAGVGRRGCAHWDWHRRPGGERPEARRRPHPAAAQDPPRGPHVPRAPRQAGVAGVVILECVIDRGGLVQSVRVLSGHPLLNEAAARAVRQWAYRPTLLNGVPVAVVMTVTVRFDR